MTLHDPEPSRKPPRRFWLYAPYVAVLAGALVWSGVWVAARAGVARGLDEAAARLRAQGYAVAWKDRAIGGYPFRIDVTLDGLDVREPSGWGLAGPRLEAEAYAYHLDQWIAAAPQGVVLTRPGAGAVAVTGQVLRASVIGTGAAPRVAVEGVKLVFTPQPGARPYPLASAERLGFYVRPLAGDRAEGLLRLARLT